MQRNLIVTVALVGALIIVAVSSGFVIARLTASGQAGRYPGSPGTVSPSPAGGSSMGSSSAPASPGQASDSPNSSLAQFIAEKAGTRLAGNAPQNVPASQVLALSDQVPGGAIVDRNADTITFSGSSVSFTVVAIAPGAPDMTFRVAGLSNPAIIVPKGSHVAVRFINNDSNEAHGWLITTNQPPFGFGQSGTPAIGGARAGVLGDPTSAGDGAISFSFVASGAGSYQYICPMPGHAQMGMHGPFIVR
jgi:rusticyanin